MKLQGFKVEMYELVICPYSYRTSNEHPEVKTQPRLPNSTHEDDVKLSS